MKRILTLTLSLLALSAISDLSARCCGGAQRHEQQINKAECPPAPCCVTTVEVRKPAKKIVECDCRWECPTDCETKHSGYVLNGGSY
ncbi:MAG TPA: hypothetical protein VHA52_08870 [Candidatus Babeliaceae bacterium]|nr:hypothetical protein [Candidatus Babeliaceae bacterium]